MKSPVEAPTYARYLALHPPDARARLRGAALSALASGARLTGQLEEHLLRPRVQFIYLHHVFRDEEAGFRRLLRDLARHHTFLSHSDAVDRVTNGRIDRPYVSLSFDDGFADNRVAADILEEFGARGCFYVCPGIVGERDAIRLHDFCRSRLQFPLPSAFLDWDDLESLLARGHEVGAHTMTHPNLGEIGASEMEMEIVSSRDEIVTRLGGVRHFAWPRGQWRHFTSRAREMVFNGGFDSCASAVRGAHVVAAHGPARDLCIRRDHVLANWPLQHVQLFLMLNSMRASERDNRWPDDYAHPA